MHPSKILAIFRDSGCDEACLSRGIEGADVVLWTDYPEVQQCLGWDVDGVEEDSTEIELREDAELH